MRILSWLGRTALVVASALAIASPSIAQGFDGFIDDPATHSFDVFPDSMAWKYFRTSAYCYASIENERGFLLLGYDRRRDQAHVAFWNRNVPGYKSADTTYLEIILIDIIQGVGLGEPNRDWGSNKFVIRVNAAGQRVFNTKLRGAQMLGSFSKFDRLAFMDNDAKVVQNFDMTHSARAMNRLRVCVPR